jgi:hypothetical protein
VVPNPQESKHLFSSFIHKRIILADKRVEFVSNRMSHLILGGCRFHIIVLNVYSST